MKKSSAHLSLISPSPLAVASLLFAVRYLLVARLIVVCEYIRRWMSESNRCSKEVQLPKPWPNIGAARNSPFLRGVLGVMLFSTTATVLATRCAARELPLANPRSALRYKGAFYRGDQTSPFAVIPVVHKRRFRREKEERPAVVSSSTTKKGLDNPSDAKSWKSWLASPYVQYTKRQVWRGAGIAISSVGFLSSSVSQLVADRAALRRWKPTVEALGKFMKTTGIDLELSKSLNARLLHNVILLGRVQSSVFQGTDRRDLVLKGGRRQMLPTNEEGLRFMKFATSVYGDSMIAAAEMDVTGKINTKVSRATRTRISDHVGVPEDDVVLLDVDHGGSTKNLRHFVAIDHKNKEVVLSIRGTFSLSEMVVDVAGFSRPFCGGEAHSEMANMAERVWEAAGPTVLSMLKKHEDYGFVVTGHSLGAGTACLVNILVRNEKAGGIKGRRMRCFAYAPPPCFTPLERVPDAVRDCTSYVHENDAIPSLSIDSVRHFFSSIGVIERYSQKTKHWPQLKVSWGFAEPDSALLRDVRKATKKRLMPKKGAPILVIPSASVLWMREKGDTGQYDTKVCDPRKMATLGIFVTPNMLQDHFPPTYEHALHNPEDEDSNSRTGMFHRK